MKNLIIFTTLFFAVANAGAQNRYSIKEMKKSMSNGAQNALVMDLPKTSQKTAEEEWKDYIKDYKGKTKEDRKSNLWFTDDAKMPSVSDNTVDVYASFSENKGAGSTTISVWFDLGGAYLSSSRHKSGYRGAEQFLQKFGAVVDKRLAKDQLDEQENVLKDLQSELKKLEKDNETYQKKIEDAQKLIAEMESEIAGNLTLQKIKQREIASHLKVMEATKEKFRKN